MSASEKLRALEAAARPYHAGEYGNENVMAANRCVDVVQSALPQIIAVVEAAEKVSRWPAAGAGQKVLRDPLAALDEALP